LQILPDVPTMTGAYPDRMGVLVPAQFASSRDRQDHCTACEGAIIRRTCYDPIAAKPEEFHPHQSRIENWAKVIWAANIEADLAQWISRFPIK
jgi:hypothetical protein